MVNSSTLLVVCHANICRSPMAEAVLRRELPNVAVSSAGVEALVGYAADAHAVEAAAARDLDIASHRARALDPRICAEAELILVMEDRQRRTIESRYPFTKGRVFCLGGKHGAPIDIPDPYGRPRDAFDRCIALIESAVDHWKRRIAALV